MLPLNTIPKHKDGRESIPSVCPIKDQFFYVPSIPSVCPIKDQFFMLFREYNHLLVILCSKSTTTGFACFLGSENISPECTGMNIKVTHPLDLHQPFNHTSKTFADSAFQSQKCCKKMHKFGQKNVATKVCNSSKSQEFGDM